MEELFQKGWRMDWGLGNPNITAALIVTLLVGVWSLAYIHRKGFWVALPLFAFLGVCLIHTLSRGGLFGAFAGLGVLLCFAPRPWPRIRWIAVVVAFWVAVLAGAYLQAYERLGQGIAEEDKSITHRLIIWKVAPQMLADAPGGWGIDKAGDAYMQWYQTPGRDELYGSLINTHLSKVVELGVLLGSVYLFCWFLAFVLAWPDAASRWRSVPLGILVGFAVVASFTNMAKTPQVWILPVLGLLAVIGDRLWRKKIPNLMAVATAGIAAVLMVGGVYIYGSVQSPSLLTATEKSVIWKGETAKAWVFIDNQVFGRKYAHTWRKFVTRTDIPGQDGVGFTSDSGEISDTLGLVIISGKPSETVLQKVRANPSLSVLLLNPSFEPGLLGDLQNRHVEVIAGEFSPAASRGEWRSAKKFTILPGVGDYLPAWPEFVLAFMDKSP